MSAAIALEQVFFVSYRDVALGYYPMAEPVVLIDPALEHHYIGVRQLELRDAPGQHTEAPPASEALPLFPIDRREAVLYESARPAVIAVDTRRG